MLEAVLQLLGYLENDVHPGESEVLGREARMHGGHIGIAWRALVVVDMG